MRQVFLNDFDISKFVMDIPQLSRSTGEFGQLIAADLPAISGLNTDGFWDSLNPTSPFYSLPSVDRFTISCYVDTVKIFDGKIQSINADNQSKTASIQLRTSIVAALNQGIVYQSNAISTPADIVREICVAYDIPINPGSFASSNGIYNDNEVRVSAQFLEPNTTVLDALQQVAVVGIARIYIDNGQLYFDAYYERTSSPIVTFSSYWISPHGTTLYSHPHIESLQKEPCDGYSVSWLGGSATFGGTRNVRSISASMDSPVRVLTLASAIWVGETYMAYLNRPQSKITFDGPTRLGREIPLGSPVEIDYTFGNWAPTTIDLVSIDPSDRIRTVFAGVTR